MAFLTMIFGHITLHLQGMNVENFIKYLVKNKIYIKEVKRQNYNSFYIKTNCFYYKKLLEQANKLCYNISVVKTTGLYGIFAFFKKRIALAIILIIGIVFTAIASLFVWQIEINGTQNVSSEQIAKVLSDNNICSGVAKTNINVTNIEQLLYDNFEHISLASATIYGNSLIINVKEKLFVPEMQKTFEPLLATNSGVIQSINLISGTLNCKVGDTVKKGDVLVYPHIFDANNNIRPIIALAEIVANVDVVGSVEYNTNQTIYTRTGKRVVNKKYSLWGINYKEDKNKVPFANYEIDTQEYYAFDNNILPILITKTIYYQTTGEDIVVPFDQVKQQQIDLSKTLAYNNLPSQTEVLKEQTIISNDQNIYYIVTYLTTLQSIV